VRSLGALFGALVLAAPASAANFYAAGFSGAFTQAVALGPSNEVVACRAAAALGEGLAVRIERWTHADGLRIVLSSDRAFDVHMVPVDALADGRRFDLPRADEDGPDGLDALGAVAVRLTPAAEAALVTAQRPALDAEGYEMPLPSGLAGAVRFLARCGA